MVVRRVRRKGGGLSTTIRPQKRYVRFNLSEMCWEESDDNVLWNKVCVEHVEIDESNATIIYVSDKEEPSAKTNVQEM
jgi:hypothetical protein